MLSDFDALTRLKGGLAPFRCDSEIWDYQDKLRFRVFDQNGTPVLRADAIPQRVFRDPVELGRLVSFVRSRLQNRGKLTRDEY
jgi:hypothetical protein